MYIVDNKLDVFIHSLKISSGIIRDYFYKYTFTIASPKDYIFNILFFSYNV